MKLVSKSDEPYIDSVYGEKATEVRQHLSDYMKNSPAVLTGMSGGSKSAYKSDGKWVWTVQGAEAVSNGSVDPDREFLDYVESKKVPPTELDKDTLSRAFEIIANSDKEGKDN